jgi:murein DD-endopeptidase MepM/ murein hydrolase activator NlpD
MAGPGVTRWQTEQANKAEAARQASRAKGAYVDPVPNAKARNWGGQQGRAAGMSGSLNSKNVGADYLADYGSPLYAPVSGQIVQIVNTKFDGTESDPNIRRQAVNENYGWGSMLLIKGDDGKFHRLSHMVPNSSNLQSGDRIEAGQQVGQVGQSGNTMGSGKAGGAPHLDWEVFTTKSGNPLGGDRSYEDPRALAFGQGGQFSTGGLQTARKGEAAGSSLNRGAMSPAMRQWADLIEAKAKKYGVPPSLLAGIVDYESGGKADAGHKVSGATGLGQVMPKGSGPHFGDRPTKQELLDPDTNLEWSAKILAANYKRYNNNPESAAAAYLGAVDAKGNPTTAADANGTNGFKYVQEVMGRAGRFQGEAGAPGQATDDGPDPQQEERKMAQSVKDMVGGYNDLGKEIAGRLKGLETKRSAAEQQLDKDRAALTGLLQIAKPSPEQNAQIAALNKSVGQQAADVKALNEQITEARTDQESNNAALTSALTVASGKILSPEEREQIQSQSRAANASALEAETRAKLLKPGEPGYDNARAEADLARKRADTFDRTLEFDESVKNRQLGQGDRRLDLDERGLGQRDRELGQGDRRLGQDDRRIGLEEYEKYATTPAIVERTLAAAGVDRETAKRISARLDLELDDLRADTKLKGDQSGYQRAITNRVNQLVAGEMDQLVQGNRLTKAQADKAIGTLGSDIAMAEQNVRQGQAATGLTQAQTWNQMVQAQTAQFEQQMKQLEAETWKQVQKVASDPNASDEDIMGAIQAGSRNATEAAQVYQTRINQYQQEEVARSNKVKEGIDIQRADEEERNNRYTNLAGVQNARANMQNASTNAVGPRLGATGMANAMAGLGMVVGSEGLDRLAMQSGTGASVVNPVKEGLAPFEKDQATLRAGVRDNRLADPNAKGTEFKAPRATAATRGIGQGDIPKFTPIDRPAVEGVDFKAPTGPTATVKDNASGTEQAITATPEQAMTNISLMPKPDEEEQGGGGGGKRSGKGGPRVVFTFKPPKAKRGSTAVDGKQRSGGGGGYGAGFRVPGRKAA